MKLNVKWMENSLCFSADLTFHFLLSFVKKERVFALNKQREMRLKTDVTNNNCG